MLLRPYSLGHELWLIREGNSLVGQASSLSAIDHLPAAVLICCQSWEELKRMRSDHLLGLKLWLWNRRIKSRINREFTRINANENGDSRSLASIRGYQEQELAKFISYRNEGLLEFPCSQVTRADRGPSPRLPGTPFILRLQQWLMTHLQLTESSAWDYPVGLAKMRWAAHWEQEGGLEIYNAHEEQEDAFIAYWESRGGPEAMTRAQAQKERQNAAV